MHKNSCIVFTFLCSFIHNNKLFFNFLTLGKSRFHPKTFYNIIQRTYQIHYYKNNLTHCILDSFGEKVRALAYCLHYATITKSSNLQFPWLTASKVGRYSGTRGLLAVVRFTSNGFESSPCDEKTKPYLLL